MLFCNTQQSPSYYLRDMLVYAVHGKQLVTEHSKEFQMKPLLLPDVHTTTTLSLAIHTILQRKHSIAAIT